MKRRDRLPSLSSHWRAEGRQRVKSLGDSGPLLFFKSLASVTSIRTCCAGDVGFLPAAGLFHLFESVDHAKIPPVVSVARETFNMDVRPEYHVDKHSVVFAATLLPGKSIPRVCSGIFRKWPESGTILFPWCFTEKNSHGLHDDCKGIREIRGCSGVRRAD